MKSEHETQKSIIEILIKSGWEVIRINSVNQKYYKSYTYFNLKVSQGLSDLIAFEKADNDLYRLLFIEVKSSAGELQDSQKKVSEHFARKGIKYLVIKNSDELIKYLKG